ncbi:MAG TPA: hypothetical protein VMG12_43165 [Polyangiaceae bacterium]|nr:hypothetical protein [Polyangiaceae bacterium]
MTRRVEDTSEARPTAEAGPSAGAQYAARIRSIPRRRFTPELIDELHALSNRMMQEELEHFSRHAHTNDVVHVFERVDTGALVGFQFWKTVPVALPRAAVIVGGKLRILPEFRRQALHLRSGLRFYARSQLRHPRTRFYRLSLASIFGFTSIASSLARYRSFEPRASDVEGRALAAVFEQVAAGSGYGFDRDTGLFDVRIFMTDETLARYPASFFDKPAARAYAEANPDYRTNGCYVGFWFRFSRENLVALLRAVRRRGAG